MVKLNQVFKALDGGHVRLGADPRRLSREKGELLPGIMAS